MLVSESVLPELRSIAGVKVLREPDALRFDSMREQLQLREQLNLELKAKKQYYYLGDFVDFSQRLAKTAARSTFKSGKEFTLILSSSE